MTEKCVKCDAEVLVKDSIKCSECAGIYHSRCAGSTTRNKKTWRCEGCIVESASNSSKANECGTSASTILDAINAFRKENNDKWDSNTVAINKVLADMSNIKEEVVGLKNQFAVVKRSCEKNAKDVTVLQFENKRLTEELTTVKQQVLELEQHSRKSNIIITGVPITPREDVMAVIRSVARALDIEYNRSDVSAAHRLRGRRGDTRPAPIVVSFVSRLVKMDWMGARRKKGALSARDLFHTLPDSPVYINEHLTPATRVIFNAARELIKHSKVSSVWTTDCRVMARITPESRPIQIKDLQQISVMAASNSPQNLPPPTSPGPPSVSYVKAVET